MKSTVVDESLSYYKTNVLFQRTLQDFKIMNSVFSLLSFNCIDVIQLAILVKVFSVVLIVFISAVWHFTEKDFLILWSSANPDSVMDDGMESVMSEQ